MTELGVAPGVRWGRRALGVPPHLYFVVSAIFHYLGPAFAVLLFARVDVLGVAWLRIVTATIVFVLWRRPWRAWGDLAADARRTVLWWGLVLAAMNCSFYIAIDRLPLGTVAAIEFTGPILLAALGVRTFRNVLALVLAGIGVYVLTGIRMEGEPLRLMFAFVNAGLFTLYIVLGHRVAQEGPARSIDLLGTSMMVAAIAVAPLGLWKGGAGLFDPVTLLAGIGVGISSSVIPYVADQLALGRLARSTYALFVSLLPATATVVGVLVLAQIPSLPDMAGVTLVIAGVAAHQGRQNLDDAPVPKPASAQRHGSPPPA